MLSYWETEAVVERYSEKRQTWWGFYDSERWMLGKLPPIGSVLDFGCATGGLRGVLDAVDYVGVDQSGKMLEVARERYPAARFVKEIPKGCRKELAISLGTLHVCPDWREILERLWSCATRYLVFDVRIGEARVGIHQGTTDVPYEIVDIDEVFGILRKWKPKSIAMYGYDREACIEGGGEVTMAVFRVEK